MAVLLNPASFLSNLLFWSKLMRIPYLAQHKSIAHVNIIGVQSNFSRFLYKYPVLLVSPVASQEPILWLVSVVCSATAYFSGDRVVYGIYIPCIWLLWCILSGVHTSYHTHMEYNKCLAHHIQIYPLLTVACCYFLNWPVYGLNVILGQQSNNLSRDHLHVWYYGCANWLIIQSLVLYLWVKGMLYLHCAVAIL